MEKVNVVKVIIQWSPAEEDSETLIMDKLWNFTTDNFGGEIPCVGDKMLLNLPIENSLGRHKPWKFQVVQRTWEPENSKLHLKVRLDNPQEFLDLSEEKKDTLKYRLEQEPYNKRPRRPPMSLERVHVVLTSEQQETQDLERSTSKSDQEEEKSHQESKAKTPVRDLEITDTIVHNRKRQQLDPYSATFTQIHQQGC